MVVTMSKILKPKNLPPDEVLGSAKRRDFGLIPLMHVWVCSSDGSDCLSSNALFHVLTFNYLFIQKFDIKRIKRASYLG